MHIYANLLENFLLTSEQGQAQKAQRPDLRAQGVHFELESHNEGIMRVVIVLPTMIVELVIRLKDLLGN